MVSKYKVHILICVNYYLADVTPDNTLDIESLTSCDENPLITNSCRPFSGVENLCIFKYVAHNVLTIHE